MMQSIILRGFIVMVTLAAGSYFLPHLLWIPALIAVSVMGEGAFMLVFGVKTPNWPRTIIIGLLLGVPGAFIGAWVLAIMAWAFGIHIGQFSLFTTIFGGRHVAQTFPVIAYDFMAIILGVFLLAFPLELIISTVNKREVRPPTP